MPKIPVIRPIWAIEPVARKTSKGTATKANVSPRMERVCPAQTMLKVRLLLSIAAFPVQQVPTTRHRHLWPGIGVSAAAKRKGRGRCPWRAHGLDAAAAPGRRPGPARAPLRHRGARRRRTGIPPRRRPTGSADTGRRPAPASTPRSRAPRPRHPPGRPGRRPLARHPGWPAKSSRGPPPAPHGRGRSGAPAGHRETAVRAWYSRSAAAAHGRPGTAPGHHIRYPRSPARNPVLPPDRGESRRVLPTAASVGPIHPGRAATTAERIRAPPRDQSPSVPHRDPGSLPGSGGGAVGPRWSRPAPFLACPESFRAGATGTGYPAPARALPDPSILGEGAIRRIPERAQAPAEAQDAALLQGRLVNQGGIGPAGFVLPPGRAPVRIIVEDGPQLRRSQRITRPLAPVALHLAHQQRRQEIGRGDRLTRSQQERGGRDRGPINQRDRLGLRARAR